MRGRKPKPTFLRVVEGNPGRRPLNKREPKPSRDLAAAPADLTDTQKLIWNDAIASAPAGLLKQLDQSVLRVWVVACDIHVRATMALEKTGLVTLSPDRGVEMQSPYLAIVNKQAAIMMKAAAELGFSPSSRSRVTVAPDAEADEFEKFLGS